jgi:hypothetical protein
MLRLSRFIAIGYIVLCLAVLGATAARGPLGYAPFQILKGPAGEPVTVTVWYGTEKKEWLEEATRQFLASGPTFEGHPITVQLQALGSRDIAERVARQDWKNDPPPTVISPASSLWVETLRSEWASRGNSGAIIGAADAPRPLVLTPLVLVAWEQRAKYLWPAQGGDFWGSVHDALANPGGWPALAGQEGSGWGPVKFGHTSPLTSNSGAQTLLLLAYAYHKKATGLTRADVTDPGFVKWMSEIESSVPEFGDSSGTFMDNIIRSGPGMYDLAAVYENLALQRLEEARSRWQPLKLYYPPATILSDHPYVTLEGSWVTPAQRGAANLFRDYLLSPPMQQLALKSGFRPADPSISLASGDPANPFVKHQPDGVKLDINQQVQVPSGEVLSALLDVWRSNFGK